MAISTAVNSANDAWDMAEMLLEILNTFANIVEERDLVDRILNAEKCVIKARNDLAGKYADCVKQTLYESGGGFLGCLIGCAFTGPFAGHCSQICGGYTGAYGQLLRGA